MTAMKTYQGRRLAEAFTWQLSAQCRQADPSLFTPKANAAERGYIDNKKGESRVCWLPGG
jgi:hypothetical protein